MYKQIETQKKSFLRNGAELNPVATLACENHGIAHIWIDDHCYVLGLERDSSKECENQISRTTYPTSYIFPEAFNVLKTLPDLIQP